MPGRNERVAKQHGRPYRTFRRTDVVATRRQLSMAKYAITRATRDSGPMEATNVTRDAQAYYQMPDANVMIANVLC